MPLDPVLVTDVQEWLRKASVDLRGAQIDLAATPPLIEDAVFHTQQAVEKSLKAFLTFHNQPFRRTHNLEEIGEACLRVDATLRPVVNEAVPRSEYAWAYRYPGSPPTPSIDEDREALNTSHRAYAAVLARLPAETHP